MKSVSGLDWLDGDGVGAVLARGASGSFFVIAIGSIVAFATNIVLARILGVSQYGVYIYVLTWINLLALVCQLGLPNSLLKFIPAYTANSEWGLLRGIFVTSFKYTLVVSVIVAVTAGIVILIATESKESNYANPFWIGLMFLPLVALTELRQASLRSFKRVVLAELPNTILRPVLISVLAAIFYIFLQKNMKAQDAMLVNLIATVFAFYAGTSWMMRVLPKNIQKTESEYDFSAWVRVAVPQLMMSAIVPVLHQTDVIMIGALLTSDEAGIYAVSSRLAGFSIFGLMAANAIVVPMISELYSKQRHADLQRVITLSARGILVFAIAIVAVLILGGEFILSIFGSEFIDGYVPLLLLLMGQLFNALAGSAGFLLTMMGYQNHAALILGTCALINIALNALLISQFGISGAALATSITTMLCSGAMIIYVRRKLHINPTVFARLK